MDQNLLDKYILFEDTMCVIGGKKCMPDAAILKLFTAMERLFFQKYTVSTGECNAKPYNYNYDVLFRVS